VQIECTENLFSVLKCSLSYAKIVQIECTENLFSVLKCSLSYAKIRLFLRSDKFLLHIFRFLFLVATKSPLPPTLYNVIFRNRLFRDPKEPISDCERAYFAT